MIYLCLLYVIILLYMFCDVNYVIRTLFTVLSGRFYQGGYSLKDTTTIYGICTFHDCDISFKSMRMARLVREIDFARYHFYDRTGIYHKSCKLGIKSLQGSTLTTTIEAVKLFMPYKIDTKLMYWDGRSLFFEHEVRTLHDCKLRYRLVSRQYALGSNNQTTAALLDGLPGSEVVPQCPQYITEWLLSLEVLSSRLRQELNK